VFKKLTFILLLTPPLLIPPRSLGAAPEGEDSVIAKLDKITITRSQILRPLIEGYGLNVLLNIATLELAEQEAEIRKLSVTQADIDAEREQTLSKMFGDADKKDYPNLLEQFLQQQRISKPEFEIVLQTNAYLRKIAEPMVKAGITEERLQESFKALYGETIQVRHIQCANLQEIAEAKRRLAAGEPFEEVARKLSRNTRTAPLGGAIPPFSRYATAYPEVFKDVAFSLKVDEVSDTVQVNDTYNLIKLEKRFEPKAVKYDDVKESLRRDLTDRLVQSQVKNLRQQLVDRIAAQLSVDDPELAKQYEAKKTRSDGAVHGKKEALDAIRKDGREDAKAAPQPEGLRPPATMPGGTSPGASSMPIIVQPTTRP
jgi:foldase protein PrsA